MTIPSDGYADGGEPYTDEEMELIYKEEEQDYVECPLCGGIGSLMGQLGNLVWFRCLNCGIDFNVEKDKLQ